MKKPNKQKTQRRARKLLAKRTEKNQKNKAKRLKRWRENVDAKRAEKETFIMEEEIRKIQVAGERENKEVARKHLEAKEAAAKTAESYDDAKQNLKELGE
jgi:hypothetical protein